MRMRAQIRSFFLGALEGALLSLPRLELLTLHLDPARTGHHPAFTFGASEMGGEGVCSALGTLVTRRLLPALEQARFWVFWHAFCPAWCCDCRLCSRHACCLNCEPSDACMQG